MRQTDIFAIWHIKIPTLGSHARALTDRLVQALLRREVSDEGGTVRGEVGQVPVATPRV